MVQFSKSTINFKTHTLFSLKTKKNPTFFLRKRNNSENKKQRLQNGKKILKKQQKFAKKQQKKRKSQQI